MVVDTPQSVRPSLIVRIRRELPLLAAIAACLYSMSLIGQTAAVPSVVIAGDMLRASTLSIPVDPSLREFPWPGTPEILRVIALLAPLAEERLDRALGVTGVALGLGGSIAIASAIASTSDARRLARALGYGSARGARRLARPLVAILSLIAMALALRYAWLGEDWLVPDWQERFDRAVDEGLLTVQAGIGSDEIRRRLLERVHFRGLFLIAAGVAAVLLISAIFCPRSHIWGRSDVDPPPKPEC